MSLENDSTRVFHELWGQAKDGVYDKEKWAHLQVHLSRLVHALNACEIHKDVECVVERTACALCFAEAVRRANRVRQKAWRRKKELRTLNKSYRMHTRLYWDQVNYANAVADLLREERERQKKTDYRSVCQCRTCRLREWWRFRTGQTYPGRPGWRFPWVTRRS